MKTVSCSKGQILEETIFEEYWAQGIRKINIPSTIDVSSTFVNQLFRSRISVSLDKGSCQIKVLKEEDLPRGFDWPEGVKSICLEPGIKKSSRLMKQLFKCKVEVHNSQKMDVQDEFFAE